MNSARVRAALLLCAVSTVSSLANAAESSGSRFTLICTGETETDRGREPSSFEIRVDLQSRIWCDKQCENVRSFANIDRGHLTFSEFENGIMYETAYVDRENGKYTQMIRSSFVNSTTEAQCERGPAKPITYPKRKF